MADCVVLNCAILVLPLLMLFTFQAKSTHNERMIKTEGKNEFNTYQEWITEEETQENRIRE